MPGQPGELPKKGSDGNYYWADGTPVTWAESQAVNLAADGHSQQEIADAINTATYGGAWDPSTGVAPTGATGTGAFPNGQPNTTVTGDSNDLLEAMGYLPTLVSSKSPGAELGTDQAEEEGLRLQRLLGDLQQQATTGGGAWEQSLKNATETAQASAQALGASVQNQSGGSYMGALRNVGNAQAAAGQRAVGQGNILREKSKMGAQDAISALSSGMGKTAAEQAAAQAAARRQVRNVNAELIDNAEKTTLGTVSGIAQAAMSKGGEVPGEPQVFGDDSRNDTVPAMLSPKEIVIPISIATAPNAPELAADFVAALQAREGGEHAGNFADGGEAGDGLEHVPVESLFTPSSKGNIGYQALRDKYSPVGPPTVEGGGKLNTSAYDYARGAQNQNAALLEQRAAGQGPSVVPQMMQNTSDSNIEAALQAQAAGKGGADLVGRTTAAQQGAAGQAAAVTAQEQAAGQEGAAKALLDQQARDNAFAIAQQQAAWHNTMMNVGLGLDQQARLQQLMGGVGQGLAAASSLDFGDTDVSDYQEPEGATDQEFADALASEGSELGDYGPPADDAQYAAHGGRIKGLAEGGYVPPLDDQFIRGEVTGYMLDEHGNRIRPVTRGENPEKPVPDSGIRMESPPGSGRFITLKQGIPVDGVTATTRAPEDVPVPAIARPSGAEATADNPMRSDALAQSPAAAVVSAVQNHDAQVDRGRMDLAKAKADLGIVPKGDFQQQPAAPPAAVPPPAAATKPHPTGAGSPGTGDIRAGMDREMAAAEAMGQAQQQQAVATVNAIDAAQKVAQANALDAKARTERARQETDAMKTRYDAAVDEMRNVSTTVDPGRYWASRSTGQRVLGIIGLALGAIGAGKDGINRAVTQLNTAIDRDIDAQKTELSARLAKGRASVDAAQGAFAQARAIFQDDLAATAASKAAAYELADLELKKVVAGTASPIAKAQAAQLSGQLQAKKGELLNQAYNIAFDNTTNRMLAEAQAARAGGAGGMDQKQQGQLFEIGEREKEIQQSGSRLLQLIDQYGTQEKIAPGVEAEMNQAINGMIIASAKMQDRDGVVREPDEARERKSLGFEPGFFQRGESAKRAIQSYIANADRRRNNALAVRGLR